MPVSMLDNFNIRKKAPNVERDLFNTIEDMKNYSENYLPDVFECNVIEDGNRYRYNRSNIDDSVLGKWRLAGGGASATDLIDYYKKTEVDSLLENKVNKVNGKDLSTNDYTTLEKEKLANLENYDDTEVREHITNSEQAISDIQNSLGSDTLATTAQTIKGAINEVKTNSETFNSNLDQRIKANEDLLAIINGDSSVAGSIKKSASTTLKDAKNYTDQKIAEMASEQAIVCDEKPTYLDGITTYLKDGQPLTTEEENIWFYYEADGQLKQTIWINGEEITIVSAGGVNFQDFVSKTTDVVSTYDGTEADTDKIPDVAALQSLQQLIQVELDKKIDTDDIYDGVDNSSSSLPLSANQGKLLNEKIDTKLDKVLAEPNKHLITDSLGNITLADYDTDLDLTSTNAVQNKAVKAELDTKLSISQDVAKAGYVATIGEDGNITFTEATTLGGTAETTSYENEDYPDLTNVDAALDKLFNHVFYEALNITSFTCNVVDTHEIGTVLTDIIFSWSYNKEVKSQALTDCVITIDDREATYVELKNTKTFVLTASDGSGNTGGIATASKKISFLPKIYWGCAIAPDELNSEFVLGLSNSKLTSSPKGDYSFDCGVGEYAYIITPTSQGFKGNIWVNGFQSDMIKENAISLTNTSGHTQSYDVWRFTNSGLGTFTATIQ